MPALMLSVFFFFYIVSFVTIQKFLPYYLYFIYENMDPQKD